MKIKKYGFFIICLFVFTSLIIDLPSHYIIENPQNDKPSSSDINDITIISPENKTYTELDSGYFPGTFGFENDSDGANPEGWDLREVAGTNIEVVDEISNHKKVLDMYDGTASDYVLIRHRYAAQTHGTVEFYMRVTDASEQHNFRIINELGDHLLRFGIGSNQFEYNDGSWHNVGKVASSNTWYHISIHFECASEGYMGLSQYNWRVEIDGDTYGDYGFFSNQAFADYMDFHIVESALNTHLYLDAIGFSWENYEIGDNLNEGLLLNFESSFAYNWTGYSLDGQKNVTITGNSVINMPSLGKHSIQIFGNDTLGNIHLSEKRFFSIENFKIISPENKTYTKPDSGYYPATYGFENDEDGTIPEDWDLSDDRGGTCQVISELGGHKKVVEIHDDDNYFEVHLETTFTPQTSGSIEWWWRTTSSSAANYFELHDASGRLLSVQFDESGYIRYDSSSGWSDIKTYNANRWYLMRIDFDSTSDTYDVYVDGVQEVDDASYDTSGGSIEKIFTGTGWIANNFYSYYDAISFSWDPAYNIGENLNEGLLLNFETSFAYNWTGYSLDGQPNRTIHGNTTIPLPNNGDHIIYLSIRTMKGEFLRSKSVQFSVEVTESYPPNQTPDSLIILYIIIIIIGSLAFISIIIILIKRDAFRKVEKEHPIIEDMYTICPFCQTEIAKSSKFCPYCSTKIDDFPKSKD